MLRRTKIVTTMGPATDREGVLEGIIKAGANMVRMNFSHGSAEDHIQRAKQVRELAARLGKHVAILGDLQGPKIRVSTFKDGKIFLSIGDKFVLDANLGKGEGDQQQVGIDYKSLPSDVVAGDLLLSDPIDVPPDSNRPTTAMVDGQLTFPHAIGLQTVPDPDLLLPCHLRRQTSKRGRMLQQLPLLLTKQMASGRIGGEHVARVIQNQYPFTGLRQGTAREQQLLRTSQHSLAHPLK